MGMMGPDIGGGWADAPAGQPGMGAQGNMPQIGMDPQPSGCRQVKAG